MTLKTETAIGFQRELDGPELDELGRPDVSLRRFAGDQPDGASFPKVLRRRLDRFFADGNISPKADSAMWIKIVAGLAVLAGSWIAIYAFRPDA